MTLQWQLPTALNGCENIRSAARGRRHTTFVHDPTLSHLIFFALYLAGRSLHLGESRV